MSIKDFRAARLRTSKIIGSGSATGGSPHTIVHSASVASDFRGAVTDSAMLTKVGKDVGLFVSGTKGQRGRWLLNNSSPYGQGGVTLIGGDLHVSGNVTTDGTPIGGGGVVTGSFNEPATGGKFVTTASVSFAGAALPDGYSGPATKAFEYSADRQGADTFFFVSGSKSVPGLDRMQQTHKPNQGVSVFGGDVIVSGTLYAERQVIEVDQLATGSMMISGSLFVSRSLEVQQGATFNVSQGAAGLGTGYNAFRVRGPSGDLLTINADGQTVVVNEPGSSNIDFRAESNTKAGAIVVDSSHDLIILGSEGTTALNAGGNNTAVGSDVSVYISGSTGGASRPGSSGINRSTAVSAGDFVVSGTIYTDTITAETNKLIIDGNDDVDIRVDDSFGVYTAAAGTTKPIFGVFNNDGAEGRGTVINTNGLSYLDFRVESDDKFGAILLDGGTQQLSLLVNALDASTAYTGGTALPGDIALFVSGTMGGKTRPSPSGVSTFGGDVVVSGSLHGGNTPLNVGSNLEVVGTTTFQEKTTHSDDVEVQGTIEIAQRLRHLGDTDTSLEFKTDRVTIKAGGANAVDAVESTVDRLYLGGGLSSGGTPFHQVLFMSGAGDAQSPNEQNFPDTNFFVSGAINSRGTNRRGTAVFGGDLHISGNLTVDGTTPGGGGGGGGGTVSSGSFNEPVTGGEFVTTASLSLAGGFGFSHRANTGRPDTFFFVSGSVNAPESSPNKRKSVFGGDVVMSGSLMVNRSQNLGNRVTITSDGKVGIGSDTPAYKLSVGGSMDVGDSIIHKNDTDTFIQFTDDTIGFTVGNEQLLSLAQVDGGQDIVKFGDGGDIDLQVRTAADNEAIYVRGDNGRIGIGTNNPTKKLHVEGDVHVHGASPIVSIQRNNNADDSTLSFLGSGGNTGAIAHLANTNDLVFKTHNGSTPEEMMRLGSHYGVLNRQVILLSGSGVAAASMQPKEAEDINFFVSGAMGSRHTNAKGVGVFGGDLVVSGALYAISPGNSLYVNEYIRSSEDFNTYIRFNGADTLQFGAGGRKFAQLFEGSQDLWQVNPDGQDIDFEVFGNSLNKHLIKTNAGHTAGGGAPAGSVLILSGGSGQSIDQATKSDVSFFVSGAIGSGDGGKQFAGNAVFGGDLVVSGNFHIDRIGSSPAKLVFGKSALNNYIKAVGPLPGTLAQNATDIAGPCIRFGRDVSENLSPPGVDTNFHVSGSINSRGSNTKRGTAVFGGDVVISGSLYANQTEIINMAYSDGTGSGKEFLPFAGSLGEVPNPSYISLRICPFKGRLIKVLLRTSQAGGMGSTVVGLHRGTDGDVSTALNNTPQATVTATVGQDTVTEFDFSATNAIFLKNEVIAISVDPTNNHGSVTAQVILSNEIL